MPLDAGALNRRIRIERDGPSKHDGFQNVPGVAAVLATVWASHRPGGGRERLANAENAATAPAVFRIRWNKAFDPDASGGLSPDDRVRFPARDDGALYDIASVTEIGLREGIEIIATKRTGR